MSCVTSSPLSLFRPSPLSRGLVPRVYMCGDTKRYGRICTGPGFKYLCPVSLAAFAVNTRVCAEKITAKIAALITLEGPLPSPGGAEVGDIFAGLTFRSDPDILETRRAQAPGYIRYFRLRNSEDYHPVKITVALVAGRETGGA